MTTGIRRTFAALAFRLAHAGVILESQHRLRHLPLVGGMSSIPTRAGDLAGVVDHVLPQLDRLHLFLHGYPEIPEGLARPGLIIYLASRDHPYRASGKFYGLKQETEPCLYFTFDDDILYLPGHVERLRRGLLRYGGLALVGIQGSTFRDAPSYRASLYTLHFLRRLTADQRVDELGCGTAALLSTALPIDPPAWPHGDMDDLMLATAAERHGVPRIAIARPPRSVRALAHNQPDSLYRRMLADDSRHSAMLAEFRALARR